ncbi:hypothetical protein H7F51_14595 [Novosphingobium flavum]|uniref:Uncharacterized protein n=1 Tax=Novosphingobium flavum TaxID=1778672 RepID=A0A7X1KML5_9SPHN|nr:hypothetical protein [Novosphingobium flavum]MBC2666747.1 hypothetical protein [Novosphingobium flavum]
MIGATALPSGSPYFVTLIDFGMAGVLVGGGGLGIMLLTAGGASAREIQGPFRDDQPSPDLGSKERALWALRRARENAIRARKRWFSFENHHRAFSEMRAAILGVKKEFGVGGLLSLSKGSDDPSYRDLLGAYISYVDSYLPLLESDQVDAARQIANGFSWSRGWD